MTEVEGKKEETETAKKIVHTYPLIRHSDMMEEMKGEVMELVVTACEKHSTNNEMAARMIKETMDKKFGPSWHTVVGEGFGFEISYEYPFYAATMKQTRQQPLLGQQILNKQQLNFKNRGTVGNGVFYLVHAKGLYNKDTSRARVIPFGGTIALRVIGGDEKGGLELRQLLMADAHMNIYLKEGGKKMEGGWTGHSSKWRDGSVFVGVHLLSSESVITNGPV